MHVHEAVVAAGEKESGITIHYINENYDEGDIIFQAKCEVLPADTPEEVATKVHALEYAHYPHDIPPVSPKWGFLPQIRRGKTQKTEFPDY